MNKFLNYILIVSLCAGFWTTGEMRGISDLEKEWALGIGGLGLTLLSGLLFNWTYEKSEKAEALQQLVSNDEEFNKLSSEELLKAAKEISFIIPKTHEAFVEPTQMSELERKEALKEYINTFETGDVVQVTHLLVGLGAGIGLGMMCIAGKINSVQ